MPNFRMKAQKKTAESNTPISGIHRSSGLTQKTIWNNLFVFAASPTEVREMSNTDTL